MGLTSTQWNNMRYLILLLLFANSLPIFGQIGMTLRRDRVSVAPPEIVTDGLILHLDASNASSYPGSGTTWFDLSGNNNDGTLVGGVGYSTEVGGTLTFDGVDDYVNASHTQTVVTDYLSDWSLSIWYQSDGDLAIGTDALFAFGETSDNDPLYILGPSGLESGTQSDQARLLIRNELNSVLLLQSTSTFFFDNTWINLTFVNNNGTVSVYKNGVFDTNFTYSHNLINTNTFTLAGLLRTSLCCNLDTKIGQVFMYNKLLSVSEIQQNFNATKNRFGL